MVNFAKINFGELIKPNPIDLDHSWGLDHGCWSVIRCMYPKANIPVLQLSLDRNKSTQQHLDLAKELIPLRKKGVMIVGSGNIVHNLGRVAWDRLNEPNFSFDWAEEARAAMKSKISNGDSQALANPYQFGRAWELSIPTPEHYLPLLYTLGTQLPNETPAYFNDQCVLGSLAMTSFILGDA
ncbi:MAG: dioxygenase [Bacteroidota bacterium]